MKALFLLTLAFVLLSCNGGSDANKTGADEPKTDKREAPDSPPVVVIETSMGTIKARLHDDTAPITVENFLNYVEKGHYDGTIFHRVISNFMIQGGGFELKNEVPTEKATGRGIKNESPKSKSNTRGTLAMARTSDPDSATAQFFINVTDNANLDYPKSAGHGYAVFGEVIEGMEVVDKIKEVPVGTGYLNSLRPDDRYQAAPAQDVPSEPVIIESIRVAEAE